MSEVKQYIKLCMDLLVKQFRIESCIYDYDGLSDIHFVEVNPSSLFNKEQFQNAISDLSITMNNLFPNDCIVFSSSSDNMPLSKYAEHLIDNAVLNVVNWYDLFTNGSLVGDLIVPASAGENNYALAA
ncbi:hypothetical protein FYC62_10305 [Pedobacter aquae]|uniref:Uncharacterized protein n=1 Tax=Pedobacter aquae TaxID=2605747 RepID=A0A5C0VIU7_9SPHI|nr:hypothetical protein [Pedobacter aquae]QEK51999.1 hypothetical protein FYC62_10305 [Pedobacter aquae]